MKFKIYVRSGGSPLKDLIVEMGFKAFMLNGIIEGITVNRENKRFGTASSDSEKEEPVRKGESSYGFQESKGRRNQQKDYQLCKMILRLSAMITDS